MLCDKIMFQPVYNGMLNVSSCKFNAPAFVSYPHFYNADPFYAEQFQEGAISPNKVNDKKILVWIPLLIDMPFDQDDHESHLMLEPYSGVPVDVKVRMQINMLVRPVNTSDGTNYWTIRLNCSLNNGENLF